MTFRPLLLTSGIDVQIFVEPDVPPAVVESTLLIGLVARWPMTDGFVAGSTIIDDAGSNDGTITGGITSTVGPGGVSTARAFDGVDGTFIQLTNSVRDWSASSFSIACWLMLTDITALQVGRVTFFSDDNNGDGLTKFLRLLNNNNVAAGAFAVQCCDNGVNTGVAWTTERLVNGVWCHVAYTNDGGGAGGIKVSYKDTIAAATTASAGGGAGAAIGYIGVRDEVTPGATDGAIGGAMKELWVWDHVITSAEVAEHKILTETS